MLELTYENFFEDYYINNRIGRGNYYSERYPLIIKNNKNFFKSTIKSILNCNVHHFPRDKYNILIWDTKFEKLINELSDTFNFYVVTTSLRKYIQARNHLSCNVFIAHKWMKLVDESFLSQDLKYVKKAIDCVSSYIIKHDIKVVLLGNDKLFVEKLLQYGADKARVPIIILQHGIYNEDSFKVLNTANSATHFWVWSKYVEELYYKYYPSHNCDIKIIGYPFETTQYCGEIKPCVLFLGNQYANYNKEEGEKYLIIANKVHKICQEIGIGFIYRKHPAEIITTQYNEIKECISANINLIDDLNRVTMVVGDVSSVMVESALAKKHVIQIVWSERSEIGSTPLYSFTIKTDSSYSSLYKAIKYCQSKDCANTIDDFYLHLNNNIYAEVTQYLLEIIETNRKLE